MLMLHIRQSIYLVLTNVLSASFLMFHITFDEISTTLYNSGKDRCTHTCGAMICSYFGIALFFMKIENTVYTSFQTSTLLFINGLIFDITNIQNNQSLECYHQCYHPLDLSMIKDFHGFVMFSLSLSNSVRQCHRNFTKVACQKMFIT